MVHILISQAISVSVSDLGVHEFMKRLVALSAALPYEVNQICNHVVMREDNYEAN